MRLFFPRHVQLITAHQSCGYSTHGSLAVSIYDVLMPRWLTEAFVGCSRLLFSCASVVRSLPLSVPLRFSPKLIVLVSSVM
jgi:hypothetical protein